MKTILAVYEDGVFKPLDPVELPKHSRVRVEPEGAGNILGEETEMYRLLGLRYNSGDSTGAERHNELMP
ncbi:antitoxin family protein [Candidatus Poribacteria bacterium]|nr:antitoxin family protein [Candidatus Poribacteria bacterium]